MPTFRTTSRWICFTTVILLLTAVFFSTTAATTESTGEGISAATETLSLFTPPYTASVAATRLQGQVGIPVSIIVTITPYPPPAGYYYSSVVDVIDGPPGKALEIIPGTREILVRSFTPGSYRLRIRVNLIYKSSCGGVDADILLEEEVLLNIGD